MREGGITMLFFSHLFNLSRFGYTSHKKLLPLLKEFAKDPGAAGSVVIDYGCGQKPFESVFEGFGGTYVGVDVYPGRKVDLVYDGRVLPLADQSVDLLFSASVLEHVRDLGQALNEIGRVLKPGGDFISVVPFYFHVHGSPYDFHRPTRYGWQAALETAFPGSVIAIEAVDTRFNCLIGIVTSQIDYIGLDLMRFAANKVLGYRPPSAALDTGAASPESKQETGLNTAYFILRFNPINAVLGLLAFLVSLLPIRRRPEGEITSGYLIRVRKG